MSITFLKILAGAHRVAEALVATTGMCTLPTAPALTVEKRSQKSNFTSVIHVSEVFYPEWNDQQDGSKECSLSCC